MTKRPKSKLESFKKIYSLFRSEINAMIANKIPVRVNKSETVINYSFKSIHNLKVNLLLLSSA